MEAIVQAMLTQVTSSFWLATALSGLSLVAAPGGTPAPPQDARCQSSPRVSAWARSAGPGDGVFLMGEGFGTAPSVSVTASSDGVTRRASTGWSNGRYLMAVLPQDLPSGPAQLIVANGDCKGTPVALNAPELWWISPVPARPGGVIRLFGKSLDDPGLGLAAIGSDGARHPLTVSSGNGFARTVQVPGNLPPGSYDLAIAAPEKGSGVSTGDMKFEVARVTTPLAFAASDPVSLQRALRIAGQRPGRKVITLDAGTYRLAAPLAIPAGTVLRGAGATRTILQFQPPLPATAGLVKPWMSYGTSFWLPEPEPAKSGSPARAAVLLFGSGSGLVGLRIDGGGIAEQGVAIAGTRERPLDDIQLRGIQVGGIAPFNRRYFGQTVAVLARHVRNLTVHHSQLTGSGPALFLEDVTGGSVTANTLSGGGEGVITTHEGGLRRSIIEGNRFLSRADGATQATRMLWLSTVYGSTFDNYISNNSGTDFHPPPLTDQNRGEAVLLETALSHPFVGHPVAGGSETLTLPGQGPNWSMLEDKSTIRGTRLSDYFAVVLSGTGQGQARRIVRRNGNTLFLDRPWEIAPDSGSTTLITELNYRNIITGNHISDALAGVFLWINGVENVVANNDISHVKFGVRVYGDTIGGPQSAPPFWPIGTSNLAGYNRGIGVNYFNIVERNRIDDAEQAITVTTGDFALLKGPLSWPTSAGNVVRCNVVQQARNGGITIGIEKKYTAYRTGVSATVVGTMLEDNLVEQSAQALSIDSHVLGVVQLRNMMAGPGGTSAAMPRAAGLDRVGEEWRGSNGPPDLQAAQPRQDRRCEG